MVQAPLGRSITKFLKDGLDNCLYGIRVPLTKAMLMTRNYGIPSRVAQTATFSWYRNETFQTASKPRDSDGSKLAFALPAPQVLVRIIIRPQGFGCPQAIMILRSVHLAKDLPIGR